MILHLLQDQYRARMGWILDYGDGNDVLLRRLIKIFDDLPVHKEVEAWIKRDERAEQKQEVLEETDEQGGQEHLAHTYEKQDLLTRLEKVGTRKRKRLTASTFLYRSNSSKSQIPCRTFFSLLLLY